ncbi:MAG: integrase domain-containing protein [Candidatus Saccharibacteria bacterium]|nr:integrase domain-containing protein [Candidatus Saccharibacteria bacterium]
MSRNYGLGSREMAKAAAFALSSAVKDGAIGFDTESKYNNSFKEFCGFAKENGVKQMEYVTRDLVIKYGEKLADYISNNEMGKGNAKNIISAINTVMNIATGNKWQSVSATKECGINQRTAIRETPPTGLDRAQLERGMNALSERGKAIAELAREFGLRSKESSLLNAHAALKQAYERGSISIVDGTKGGRPRNIPLTNSERQLAVLERAANVQGSARAVMPGDKNWKEWKQNGLRETRETLQKNGIERLHDLRSAYACDRYQKITNYAAPCLGGNAPKDIDRAARKQIAQELGHGRTDITNSYLGAHT